MPIYDYRCTGCLDEQTMQVRMASKDDQICDLCSSPLVTLIRPVVTVGPMPSKPARIGGTNVSFTSKEDLKAYEQYQEATGHRTLSRNDSEWRGMVDDAKESADKMLQKAGFDDHRHFKKEAGKAKASGANVLKAET